MKRASRITCALLAALLLFALTACSTPSDPPSGSPPTGAPSPSSSTPDASSPPSDELPYVELDWYTGLGNDYNMDFDMVLAQAAADYILEKLNVKVNFIWFDLTADVLEKMPILISSGQDMGIVSYGPNVGVPYLTNSLNGAFAPLDDLLDQYAPATKALFSAENWACMNVGGDIFGVPTLKDNAYVMNAVYNQTMADALGIDMSGYEWKNIMELEPLLMEVWEKRNAWMPEWSDRTLLLLGVPSPWPHTFAVDVYAAGNLGAVCNIPGLMEINGYDANTVFNLYGTPEFLEYALCAARLADVGIQNVETQLSWTDTQAYSFLRPGWGWIRTADNMHGDDHVMKLMPSARTWTDTSTFHSAGLAISSSCKEKERAMMVIELMNTDPYLATLVRWGLEEEHWVRDENGKMTQDGSIRNSDPGAGIKYQNWYGAWFGNLLIVEAPENFVGPNNEFMTRLKEINESALANHMGFVLDQEPIVTELAAVSAVIGEYVPTLQQGVLLSEGRVTAYVEEFNAKLYDNGLQRIIDEVQRQLNLFRGA